jgi:hypothetical protein
MGHTAAELPNVPKWVVNGDRIHKFTDAEIREFEKKK